MQVNNNKIKIYWVNSKMEEIGNEKTSKEYKTKR